MTQLNEHNASGSTLVLLHTLELDCDVWPAPFVLCTGYEPHSIITEDLRVLIAEATGMEVALPKRDATGAQNLRFALDNVRGEAVHALRQAEKAQQEVRLTYRAYLSNDLTAPAENPAHFIVRQFSAKGPLVDIVAGYFDLIDMQYPREVYTREFAPGLEYLD